MTAKPDVSPVAEAASPALAMERPATVLISTLKNKSLYGHGLAYPQGILKKGAEVGGESV
jgi:hypothetical protein